MVPGFGRARVGESRTEVFCGGVLVAAHESSLDNSHRIGRPHPVNGDQQSEAVRIKLKQDRLRIQALCFSILKPVLKISDSCCD